MCDTWRTEKRRRAAVASRLAVKPEEILKWSLLIFLGEYGAKLLPVEKAEVAAQVGRISN